MSEAEGPNRLRLSIVTPEEVLFDGLADWAQVPLEDGLIGIWPEHAPLVGTLAPGEVQFATGVEVRSLGVAAGHLRVVQDRVVIMVSQRSGEDPLTATPDGAVDLFDAVARTLEGLSASEENDREDGG